MDRPSPAYRGDEPFTFVCYAHDDSAIVYPELRELHESGLHLWYDEGISAGRNWRQEIGVSLMNAQRVLFYISRASLASAHCHREISLALDEGKEVVPVYLEKVELTPDLKIGLTQVHALWHNDGADYRARLLRALGGADDARSDGIASVRSGWRRMPIAVGLIALALAALGTWYGFRELPASAPATTRADEVTVPTVEVRSISSLGADPALAHYAAIATQDIKDALTAIDTRVVSVDSSSGIVADYVVDGRVRMLADGVRFSVELRRQTDGHIVWSRALDVPADITTVVEFERAQYVARAVRSALDAEAWRRSVELVGATTNPLALDAAVAARTEFNAATIGDPGDWGVAVSHFQRAIALDPQFVDPYAMLAVVYGVSRAGYTLSAAQALPLAHQYAAQALTLNPDATYALAYVNLYLDLDYAAAAANLAHLQTYLPLDSVEAFKCDLAFAQGHLNDAINHCNSALAAGAGVAGWRQLGILLFNAGRYDEAAAALQRSLELSGGEGDEVTFAVKVSVEALGGNPAAASATFVQAAERFGDRYPELTMGNLAVLGRMEDARRLATVVAERDRQDRRSLMLYGPGFWGFFLLGDIDEAFHWMERGIENRELQLVGSLRSAPLLDPLRADPRFATAMARLEEIEAQGSPTPSVATAGLVRPSSR